jgi:hypothetical protein
MSSNDQVAAEILTRTLKTQAKFGKHYIGLGTNLVCRVNSADSSLPCIDYVICSQRLLASNYDGGLSSKTLNMH